MVILDILLFPLLLTWTYLVQLAHYDIAALDKNIDQLAVTLFVLGALYSLYKKTREQITKKNKFTLIVDQQNFTERSAQTAKQKIEYLKNAVVQHPKLKYGALSVTCNPAGDLVLELHLAYPNGKHKMIEIGVIDKNFYDRVLKNGAHQGDDFFSDPTIQFAISLRDEINAFSGSTLYGWKIRNFFDLVCEYKNQELNTIVPNFFLDLMASGESVEKYARKAGGARCSTVLYKTSAQLGVDNVYVIDGPTLIQGKGFDANVIKGFFELIYQIANGKSSLHISGHSRGAVAALCINNLLVLLREMATQDNFFVDDFINKYLAPISPDVAELFSERINAEYTASELVAAALTRSSNLANIRIGLTLSDPVQGPDSYGFNQRAFSLDKSLKLNEMHQRVDIIMGSRENSPLGFDLHLPRLENRNGVPCNIYKVNCNHKTMVEKLHRSYCGKAGSIEGHFAACVLSGRAHEIQSIDALKNNPYPTRKIAPLYKNRIKVYSSCGFRGQAGETAIRGPHSVPSPAGGRLGWGSVAEP